MKDKTPAEIADKIYERISEDGWFLHPRVDVNNPGGFALVPPESDKRRCFAARWTTIRISVPSYLFDDEGPIGL